MDIQKTEVEASWWRSGVWYAGVGVAVGVGVAQGQESCELVAPGGLYHTLNH